MKIQYNAYKNKEKTFDYEKFWIEVDNVIIFDLAYAKIPLQQVLLQ